MLPLGNCLQDDTEYLQNLINKGGVIKLENRTYYIKKPIVFELSSTVVDGGNATVYYDYEQSDDGSYFESLFVISNKDNIRIQNLNLVYKGKFDHGSYKGVVSGVYIIGSDYFIADNINASGFSQAGISIGIGTNEYNEQPLIKNCHLTKNRVAGCLYGNNINGIVEHNVFEANGLFGDISTGYGFAGWSESLPVNTTLRYNKAINNYRKGLDFHSGKSGYIYGNESVGNFICGIFVNNVSGSWEVYENLISQMKSSSSASQHMVGIEIGNRNRNGNRNESISFNVYNNTIEEFDNDNSITVAVPLLVYTNNIGLGIIRFKGNVIRVGSITNFLLTSPTGGKSYSKYFDLILNNNQMSCTELTSYPIYIKGNKARNISVINNSITASVGNNRLGYIMFNEVSLLQEGNIEFFDNTVSISKMNLDSKNLIPARKNVKQANNTLKN